MCVEITKRGTRCKNDAQAGDLCLFHARRELKEIKQEFSSLQVIAKETVGRFWKAFGTVTVSAIVVFGICLLARYYFGIENLPRW